METLVYNPHGSARLPFLCLYITSASCLLALYLVRIECQDSVPKEFRDVGAKFGTSKFEQESQNYL